MSEEPSATDGNRHVTIYDVAREAGVAASTVSRAFSRPGRVNVDTAARIHEAAERLGYRATPIRARTPNEHHQVIAVAAADIANLVFLEVVRGIQEQAGVGGYTIMLLDSRESTTEERANLDRVLPLVDGAILTSSRMSDSSIRQIAKQKPVVVLNREVRDVPSVLVDDRGGMRGALEHLVELGHDHVTYLGGPEASWADGARWQGLMTASEELGVRLRRTPENTPTVRGGIRAAGEWALHPSSAVIAYNDLIAIGFMQGVKARRAEVPRDVSIIGFDNIMTSDLVTPRVTSVATARRQQGSTGMKLLIGALESSGHGATQAGPVVVPTRLVERESTARHLPGR